MSSPLEIATQSFKPSKNDSIAPSSNKSQCLAKFTVEVQGQERQQETKNIIVDFCTESNYEIYQYDLFEKLREPMNKILPGGTSICPDSALNVKEVNIPYCEHNIKIDIIAEMLDKNFGKDNNRNYLFNMSFSDCNHQYGIIVDKWDDFQDGDIYGSKQTIRCTGTQKSLERALLQLYFSLPVNIMHHDNITEINRRKIQKFHIIGDLSKTPEKDEREIEVVPAYNCTEWVDNFE